jgi:hypothetical protein
MYFSALIVIIWHKKEPIINKEVNVVLYKCRRVYFLVYQGEYIYIYIEERERKEKKRITRILFDSLSYFINIIY